MAFELPLPKVVADTEAGGGLVTAMRGMNALTQSNLENEIKRVQAQYAPLTTQAEAASKLAYANLMGPQFLAKMLGNSDIAASLSEDQLRKAIASTYAAGTGQGAGSVFNNLNQQNSGTPLNGIINKIKNLFNSSQSQPQSQTNQLLSSSIITPDQRRALQNQRPGQAIVVGQPGQGADSGYSYDAKGNNVVASPQEIDNAARGSASSSTTGQGDYFDRAARALDIKEQGKEAGKLRANDIKELNDIVFNAETKQATLDDINEMISSPEIRQIRATPLAGRHELAYYAKEGTPAQQQLVGRLYAQMGNIIKDSSRDFAGQFRKGEQQLLQGMKPTDSDTVDTMIGKSESLSVMNKLLMERSRLTSKIMSKYHFNKLEAQEFADKQINGQAIRNKIHNKLNPKPLDEDINYMAKKYNVSPDEIRKRLKAKGLI